jgi:hypothetical protein
MYRLPSLAGVCLLSLCCLQLTGCEASSTGNPAALTKANYDQIVNDGTQTLEAAETIMGSKAKALTMDDLSRLRKSAMDGQQAFGWGDEKKNIVVFVKEGKIWGKAMSNVN